MKFIENLDAFADHAINLMTQRQADRFIDCLSA
jgi:hypothetical protein